MSHPPSTGAENRRIDSWKGIAAFFGRDERTAKRWEKERGLPVHRLPGEGGGVFAWSQELLEWLNSSAPGNEKADPAPAQVPQMDAAVPAHALLVEPVESVAASSTARTRGARKRRATLTWTMAAALLMVGAIVIGISVRSSRPSGSATINVAAAPHHVHDHQAEQFYLKGRYYWSRRTAESLAQAIDAFTQAVVHDSNYAQAYAGLAECYDLMPEYTSMPMSEAFTRAIAAGSKAIALDDSLGEAHRALGFALFYGEWKVPAALTEYQRAPALDPRDEEAHHWYSTSLMALGRMQEARDEIDKAQQLNPASRAILCDQALIHFFTGDQTAAMDRLREIEHSEPDFVSAPRYLAYAAFSQKDYRTFIEQTRRLADLSANAQLLAVAGAAEEGLARDGEHGMLESMRVVQKRYFDSGQSSGFELARTCALLGRNQDAVRALKGAIAAHHYAVLETAADPTFNNLAGDAAFQELIRLITERVYRA
ncbi:hypothetical protein DYQ86_15585 [Acidobacteria bacterium AB60]|nr:hypothetical protein DYQ86_15585 [Acidobacteria bacterium AB60]